MRHGAIGNLQFGGGVTHDKGDYVIGAETVDDTAKPLLLGDLLTNTILPSYNSKLIMRGTIMADVSGEECLFWNLYLEIELGVNNSTISQKGNATLTRGLERNLEITIQADTIGGHVDILVKGELGKTIRWLGCLVYMEIAQ